MTSLLHVGVFWWLYRALVYRLLLWSLFLVFVNVVVVFGSGYVVAYVRWFGCYCGACFGFVVWLFGLSGSGGWCTPLLGTA